MWVRRACLAIASVLLLGLAWTGLAGGLDQFPRSATLGQKAQSIAQIGYGLFAMLAVVTAFRWRRWRRSIWVGWAVSASVAGGLAPVVWGGSSLAMGVLSGAASLVVAVGLVWLLRVGARELD